MCQNRWTLQAWDHQKLPEPQCPRDGMQRAGIHGRPEIQGPKPEIKSLSLNTWDSRTGSLRHIKTQESSLSAWTGRLKKDRYIKTKSGWGNWSPMTQNPGRLKVPRAEEIARWEPLVLFCYYPPYSWTFSILPFQFSYLHLSPLLSDVITVKRHICKLAVVCLGHCKPFLSQLWSICQELLRANEKN